MLGVSMTSPIDATIVTTTAPIFAMIIAAIYLREPITGKKVIGVAVGATGALMLILSGVHGIRRRRRSGSVGGRPALYVRPALFRHLFRRIQKTHRPLHACDADEMDVSLRHAVLSAVRLRFSGRGAVDRFRLGGIMPASRSSYWALRSRPICCFLIGQKNLRPTVGCMYNYVQPLVASLATVLTGMDRFTVGKGCAVVLVFLGVYIVTQSKSRAQIEAERTE